MSEQTDLKNFPISEAERQRVLSFIDQVSAFLVTADKQGSLSVMQISGIMMTMQQAAYGTFGIRPDELSRIPQKTQSIEKPASEQTPVESEG